MRILITNTVVLNSGVAATVLAMVAMLRGYFGQRAQVHVYEQRPAAAARHYPDLSFRLLLFERLAWLRRVPVLRAVLASLNRARFMLAVHQRRRGRRLVSRLLLSREEAADLENYANADLILSTGGTYLVDHYDLRPRIFDYDVALALGRPLIFFTQSVGHIRDGWKRKRLRAALDRAHLILLRDQASLENVRDLGVTNSNVHICGDAVFALTAPRGKAPTTRERPRRRIAISVRNWPYFRQQGAAHGMERFKQSIAAAVSHLVRMHEAEVQFVSTCQGIPEYSFDDSAVADQIVALLPTEIRDRVSVDHDFRSPEAMMAYLAGFDLVVATRFHMAIFAMLAGVPALAVAYEFMTRELYARMGLEQWLQEIECISGPVLCHKLDQGLAGAANARQTIRDSVEVERERAWLAVRLIEDLGLVNRGCAREADTTLASELVAGCTAS